MKGRFITCISQEKGAHRAAREHQVLIRKQKTRVRVEPRPDPCGGFHRKEKGQSQQLITGLSVSFRWALGFGLWGWPGCVVPGPG